MAIVLLCARGPKGRPGRIGRTLNIPIAGSSPDFPDIIHYEGKKFIHWDTSWKRGELVYVQAWEYDVEKDTFFHPEDTIPIEWRG